jgi:hopanoid biosynthesis associated radical SAM protein HpnH
VAVPLRQNLRIGAYLARQKLARREKFPLIVELEPLFACNLACLGCGKIQYPAHILKQRMRVETAIAAVEESGAPMVSIAGGEPLIHPEAHLITAELVRRKKFVYFCTNALLMRRKLDSFEPSPYFAWAVHLLSSGPGFSPTAEASDSTSTSSSDAWPSVREPTSRPPSGTSARPS